MKLKISKKLKICRFKIFRFHFKIKCLILNLALHKEDQKVQANIIIINHSNFLLK